jgi:hypothetical protein
MRFYLSALAVVFLLGSGFTAFSQTVDELIDNNIKAKGGIDKIKAIHSLRMQGKFSAGGMNAVIGQENMRPRQVRETFAIQGMTVIQAYDGSSAWQINPFAGRRDPQLMGDDDTRDLLIDSDMDGPLVDYKAKGNNAEYLGHDTVDGDDALRLKVTLKNGDIIYYYLDPDTFLEIRKETQEFIRGAVHENVIEPGSYKPVAGVMFPFSIASGPKNDPSSWQNVTMDKIEVNVPLENSEFAVPTALKKGAPDKEQR